MGVSSSRSRSQLVIVSLVLFVLKCGKPIQAQEQDFPVNNGINEEIDALGEYGPNELLTEEKIQEVSNTLAKLLLIPWPRGSTPLVYVETPNSSQEVITSKDFDGMRLNDIDNEETLRPVSSKRSKYYRKYPWKRQQNSRYEPSYMCAPKKEDVFRLLVALHGERNGKRGQLVDFCNRKRPASLVFTNIRFLG